MQKRLYIKIIFLLGIHLLILSKLQFTAWPEMVSFPYLINHGFVLYKDAIHAYPALLVYCLSFLYKFFGYKLIILKLFGFSTIILSDILFFLITKKLTKKNNLAVFGLLIYVILQPILEGNMVWPDLFIVPFLLLTYLLLINKKYLFAGISIGLAILSKQTGILFIGISLFWLIFYKEKFKNIVDFLFGASLTILPFLISLIIQNSIIGFINWTIIYPSQYWTKFPGYVQFSPTLRENIILLILTLPFAYLIFKAKKSIFSDNKFLLLFGFFIVGFASIYPRFSFFHFQTGIAFLILLTIYLVSKTKIKYYFLIFIPILVLVVNFKSLQFGNVRFWDKHDLELAQTIKNDTNQNQTIYLLGLNSNLYAYSDRLPNKPWLDNFGWYLEIPDEQRFVISGFWDDLPQAIFWATPEAGNWYDIGTYQPKMITDFIKLNYKQTKEIQKGVWEWRRK